MTHTAQDLKELAKRAIDEDNWEAAKFLIESLRPSSCTSSYASAMAAHAKAKAELAAAAVEAVNGAKPAMWLFTQQEMSAVVLHYARQRDDRPFRFEDVANYVARQHRTQLDLSIGNPGDRRPKWRRQVSKALEDFVNKGWLARGKKNTHYTTTATLPNFPQ